MTETESATPNDDEFWGGIWWVPDPAAPGRMRPATGRECAAEIRRVRAMFRVNALRWVPGTTHAEIDEMLTRSAGWP